jgi:hypothetical protein
MNLETTENELILVFLKSLLKKQKYPDSLEAQNLNWSIRVINDRFSTGNRK